MGTKLVELAICNGKGCTKKFNCMRYILHDENKTINGFSKRQEFVTPETKNCLNFINKNENAG